MEVLKFKKIKIRHLSLGLLLITVVYFSLKLILITFYENTYFTDGRVYDPNSIYSNISVTEKKFSDKSYENFQLFILNDISLKIPKAIVNDSIEMKIMKTDTSAIFNYYAYKVNVNKTKSLILNINKPDVSNNLKLELDKLGKGNKDSFKNYETIFKHKPKGNLLLQSFKEIKSNLKLNSLKYLLYTTQSEKGIYRHEGTRAKFFQFCDTFQCENVIVNFFVKEKELTLIFSGFTQEELDFTLSSIR